MAGWGHVCTNYLKTKISMEQDFLVLHIHKDRQSKKIYKFIFNFLGKMLMLMNSTWLWKYLDGATLKWK